MAGSRKPRRVLYGNMLRECHDPAGLVGFTQEQCEDDDEDLVA